MRKRPIGEVQEPTLPDVDEPSSRAETPGRSLLGRVASLGWRLAARLGMLAALIVLLVVFSLARPRQFPTEFNFRTMLGDSSTLIILAVGLTFVVITAGLDLSIGSVLVFASIVSAKAMAAMGGASAGWGVILLGLIIAAAAGTAWGILNGTLVAYARIPPLIVTLGTLGAALGLGQVISNGLDVQVVPTALTSSIGTGTAFGAIPWIFILSISIALCLGLLLAYTQFGRHTYAIGSNPEAARRVGIRVSRHLVIVYAMQGALAGVAGWTSLARFAGTTISGHGTDNLDAVAAVAIGGTSLFGGTGAIGGSVVGVFIPAVLQNGFLITGVQAFWQEVAVGAILIVAVAADQWRRRVRGG